MTENAPVASLQIRSHLEMKSEIAHNPYFGALRVIFERAGEQLVAAPRSLVARDAAVDARTTRSEGEQDAARGDATRSSTTFTATAPGQSLWLAPPCDGAVESIALLPGAELYLDARAWLASSSGVSFDARWHGARTFFEDTPGGRPSLLLRAWGEGDVWFGAYGGFHVLDVGASPVSTLCDTAHVVAFTHGLTHVVRQVAALASPSGHGPTRGGRLVELSGPGRVWLQTRKPSALAAFLHPFRGVGGTRAD